MHDGCELTSLLHSRGP